MSKSSQQRPELPDSRRLHQAADRLNETFLEAEKAFADLKLGVTAWVTLEESEHGWFKSLGFKKVGREFKLVVETGFEGEPESGDTTVLTSTSRETRLQAVEALPKLYAALLDAFDAEIERVNTGIARVARLTEAIRNKAGQ